jgi:hypothetical protein
MEKDIYKVNNDYVEARVIESLSDLLISLNLWREGYTRNSAGKAFNAVKALLSALIVINEGKLLSLAKDEKEKELIKKKGHTHSMYALAQMLKDAGIDVINLVNLAIDLHDYQYNGFESDFSKYSRKEDVLRDLITVVDTRKVIHEYFQKFEEKVIAEKINELVKELTSKEFKKSSI